MTNNHNSTQTHSSPLHNAQPEPCLRLPARHCHSLVVPATRKSRTARKYACTWQSGGPSLNTSVSGPHRPQQSNAQSRECRSKRGGLSRSIRSRANLHQRALQQMDFDTWTPDLPEFNYELKRVQIRNNLIASNTRLPALIRGSHIGAAVGRTLLFCDPKKRSLVVIMFDYLDYWPNHVMVCV